MNACLGPYSVVCPTLSGKDSTFIDPNQTRKVVVITAAKSPANPPSADAVVLHYIGSSSWDIRWYECPSQNGRTYTIIPTGCNVIITDFENGLLSIGDADASVYGSATFCFGYIYSENQQIPTSACNTTFEFNGHRFEVSGNSSDDFGLFDCSDCWQQDISSFGGGTGGSGDSGEPPPPPPPPPEHPSAGPSESDLILETEDKVDWGHGPTTSTGVDTLCDSENIVSNAPSCESRNNPAIAVLPSGHAVIAYEMRSPEGKTQINIASISTSVEFKIFYYRALSRGRLLNDTSLEYGLATFEIYDDVVIATNASHEPTQTLNLGFLNGPLKGGSLFRITYAERLEQPDGRPKWVFSFNLAGRIPSFDDSNDVFDVAFFISTNANLESTNPGGASVSLLTLPPHLNASNQQVPVANPSIAAANNAMMIDGSMNVFVAYQAFINNQWNIYVRQIRLSEQTATPPTYVPPYLFSPPASSLKKLGTSTFYDLIYRCINVISSANGICALFYAYLPDGRPVYNCLLESGTYVHPCGNIAEKKYASIEVKWFASCAGPPLNALPPTWTVGAEYVGPFPPQNNTFYDGPPQCIAPLSEYPVISVTVPATACCHFAGQLSSNNTQITGGAGDRVKNCLPTEIVVPAGASQITLKLTGGVCRHCPSGPNCPDTGPDGDPASAIRSAHITFYPNYERYGISALGTYYMAIVGVFIDDNIPPDGSSPPARLGWSTPLGPTNIEYSPELKQTFFVGDGIKTFNVPLGATRLFLGTADTYHWEDCLGSFQVQLVSDDTDKWCYYDSDCSQFYVYDDPYCPSPYVDYLNFTYNPADLWTIQTGDNKVTRVLYNMSASLASTEMAAADGRKLDFMFVVDATIDMNSVFTSLINGITSFAYRLQNYGFDCKFGLTMFGHGSSIGPPIPTTYCEFTTDCRVWDALQNITTGGFTTDPQNLSTQLNYWGLWYGNSAPWAAIQYSLLSKDYEWRSDALRYVMLFTNADDTEVSPSESCSIQLNNELFTEIHNDKTEAVTALTNSIGGSLTSTFLCSVCIHPPVGSCTDGADGTIFIDVPDTTGWTGDSYYNIAATDYSALFESVIGTIAQQYSGLRILERSSAGYDATFLKMARILITYEGDLLDFWTHQKHLFRFTDRPPVLYGSDKGLTQFPFDIFEQSVYAADPVHIFGHPERWVYYLEAGPLDYSYPNVGVAGSSRTDPLLVAQNSTRPTIKVNHHNDILLAYEDHNDGLSNIHIRGTGDLHYDGIIGPAGSRMTEIIDESDWAFFQAMTLPGEGANQLCHFVCDKNDITHIVWQSNRTGIWEIYYANSSNLFEPVRVTAVDSRSAMPQIDVDDNGSIYVVYHDNRFGPYEIMLSYKDERRIVPLTQQDPYLASLRNKYTHYTNILPIYLVNPSTNVNVGGLFWATTFPAGDEITEHQLFSISDLRDPYSIEFGGYTEQGGSIYKIATMASSLSGYVYGITEDAILLEMATPSSSAALSIQTDEFREIGHIPIYTATTPPEDTVVYETVFENFNFPTDWQTSSWKGGTSSWYSNPFEWCYPDYWIQWDCDYPLHYVSPGYSGCSYYYYSSSYHRLASQCSHSGETPNQRVELTAHVGSLSTDIPCFSVMFRMPSPTWTYEYPFYLVMVMPHSASATRVIVRRYTAQYTYSTVGSVDFAQPFVVDGDNHIKIDCYTHISDVHFKIYLEDNLIASFTDANQTDPQLRGDLAEFPDGYYVGIAVDCMGWQYCSGGYYGQYYWGSEQGRLSAFKLTDLNSIPVFFETNYVLDSTCDHTGRLWLSVRRDNELGQSFIELLEINKENAAIERTATIYSTSDNITASQAAVTCISDGTFYLVSHRNNKTRTAKSRYPSISGTTTEFYFQDFGQTDQRVDALTCDANNNVYAIDNSSILLQMNRSTGTFDYLSDIVDPYDAYLGSISNIRAFAYQFSGLTEPTGEEGYFHVLIKFYDNINLNGNPLLTIDSRTNMEAFLNIDNPAIEADPYFEEAYFAGTRGIYMSLAGSAMVFFSSAHYRPEINWLSYPYAFDTNQTYFPKVFLISPSDKVIPIEYVQNISFSCNRCTRLGDNQFDLSSCSYSFIINESGTYNIVVDFYSDAEYGYLLESYCGVGGHTDLRYFEVNNNPGTDEWGPEGLIVDGDKPPLVQVYPVLDQQTGLLCNVDYHVVVSKTQEFAWDNGSVDYNLYESSELDADVPNGSWVVDDVDFPSRTVVQRIVWYGSALIDGTHDWTDYQARVLVMRFDGSQEIIFTSNLLPFTVLETLGPWDGLERYKAELQFERDELSLIPGTYHIGIRLESSSGRNKVMSTASVTGDTALFIGADFGEPDWVYLASDFAFQIYGITRIEPAISAGIFRCECSSSIFDTSRSQAISQIGRWHSSAYGVSDTRITDSPQNNTRPVIKTRSSGAAIILFEDEKVPGSPEIRGATFRKSLPNEFFGSGTKSWFDYDFQISGRDVDLAVDLYDRIVTTYEKPTYTGDILPSASIASRTCAFDEGETTTQSAQQCDINKLTTQSITRDQFIASQLIKQIQVKPEFVQYYTYNAAQQVAAVVNKCQISVQVVSSPEVMALRLRNENESQFSAWCPASPEITDYTTELAWTLSPGSGLKSVCAQAMTYGGITTEFCVPIIADLDRVVFEVKLYSDDQYTQLLPQYDGVFVASTLWEVETGGAKDSRTVYIEMIPSKDLGLPNGVNFINFDVLQQGDGDLFDQVAEEQTVNGRQVFQGTFEVYKEDKVLNKDGLARIRIRYFGECEQSGSVVSGSFSRDNLNVTFQDATTSVFEGLTDTFEEYRQPISGRIGVGMPIRPQEDPYLVFGDPGFFIEMKEPEAQGLRQELDSSSSGSDGSGSGGDSGGLPDDGG